MLILSKALKDHGCKLEPQEFRELVADTFAAMFPGWSDEDLLVSDRRDEFPAVVNKRAKVPGLPGEVSLRVLINSRKQLFGGSRKKKPKGKAKGKK